MTSLDPNAPKVTPNSDLRAIDQRYRRDVNLTEAVPRLTQVAYFLWAALDVALGAFFIATVVWYLADGAFADSQRFAAAVKGNARLHDLSVARAPSELSVADTLVLGGGERSDLVAELSHSAESWSAQVRYHFAWSGGETAPVEATVLPGISYYATALGVAGVSASDARLVIDRLGWTALDRALVPNTLNWRADHLQFDVVSPIVAADVGYEAGKPVTRVDFTLFNRSAFSYWEPTFVAFVRAGRSPAAVTTFTAGNLQAGERRPISLRFFESLPVGATVEIYPLIDFLDPKAYSGPNDTPIENLAPDVALPVVKQPR